MRVLFVATPAIGHVFPLVPLAWALRAAGHDVLVATAGDALAVERAGLPAVDVSPGISLRDLIERVAVRDPSLVQRIRGGGRLTDMGQVVAMFGQVANHLADGVLDAAEAWRPDLVVHSQFQGCGALAAAKLGVPAVEHGFGFARGTGTREALREHMSESYERHGVAALPERMATIDVAPPSMVAGNPVAWSMRYAPYNGGAVLPDWLLTAPERPRIAVTLGTVAPGLTGLGAVERIARTAGDLDAEFVLALGDADTSGLLALPDNVRLAGWIPLGSLLRTCAAAVHHGGAGTTLTVLDAGLPQLVLPNGADRYINAQAVSDRGLGLVGDENEVDADLIGELLRNEKLRQAAADVRTEMANLPAPATLVPRLEALATG